MKILECVGTETPVRGTISISISITIKTVTPDPIANIIFKAFLFVRVWEHAKGMSAEFSKSVGPRDTSPLSVHARWPGPRGRILQDKIRETHFRKTRHILPWFDKPPDDGAVPILQRHKRNIRFQLAAVDEYKTLIVEHGIKLGSRNEAVAMPNTLADTRGREVTVFRFVGGATLVEAFHAAYEDFQEDMKQKKPDTLERYNQVSAALIASLTDVTLLDERTPTSSTTFSAGNALHGVGARSSFMERYLKTTTIEEKWHQKRKQEAAERHLQKKRRESTSEG